MRYFTASLLAIVVPAIGLYLGAPPAFALGAILLGWWALDTRRRFTPVAACLLFAMSFFVHLTSPVPWPVLGGTIFGFALGMDRLHLSRHAHAH